MPGSRALGTRNAYVFTPAVTTTSDSPGWTYKHHPSCSARKRVAGSAVVFTELVMGNELKGKAVFQKSFTVALGTVSVTSVSAFHTSLRLDILSPTAFPRLAANSWGLPGPCESPTV